MSGGIRDRVAIVGMGCSRFGERWDASATQLMQEAFAECLDDAGLGADEIDAAWLGSCVEDLHVGRSGIPLAMALRLGNVPVTRVENFCATGTEAFRGAVYAVAAGASRIALAMGVEKLKDTGYGGLPEFSFGAEADLWWPNLTAPGTFALLADGYAARHGVAPRDLRRAMAHVSVKSHANGLLSPKAHIRRAVTEQQVIDAPVIAAPLGLYDCCGVSDGAACAIVTTPEIARSLVAARRDVVLVKAIQIAASNGAEAGCGGWDASHFVTTRVAAARAYAEAGVRDPAADVDVAEVHDCFSITELVTMEDLGFAQPGRAVHDVLDGAFDAAGRLPCQIDGGLKCFGHPIGASGLRMLYELHAQLLGRAGERQLARVDLGLAHNLGGFPFQNVCSVTLLGRA
ncbi:MAG: acetyl-CoA acetyltransferase [Steroidobacteraceae bacterium]|nr:acetyl-CoA acetyltransferase [Steroidobacteraceae bacterium]